MNLTKVKMMLAGLGVTQEEFGRRVGLAQASTSRLFCGRKPVDPELAAKAAEALKSFITPERLMQ